MAGWLCDKNLNLNKRSTMKYTLEQCLEQQKKVDAGIKHNGEYMPWLAGIKEVIEMCDHLSLIDTWKKQPEPDMKQAFMELVDVFAFAMSSEEGLEGFEEINTSVISNWLSSYSEFSSNYVLYKLIESLCKEQFNKSIAMIKILCKKIYSRPVTDIYYYYMGKQTLTQFRQANGYKTGDYVKNWAGKEDNEHLTDMLENGVSIEYLPEALEHAYNLAVKHD